MSMDRILLSTNASASPNEVLQAAMSALGLDSERVVDKGRVLAVIGPRLEIWAGNADDRSMELARDAIGIEATVEIEFWVKKELGVGGVYGELLAAAMAVVERFGCDCVCIVYGEFVVFCVVGGGLCVNSESGIASSDELLRLGRRFVVKAIPIL